MRIASIAIVACAGLCLPPGIPGAAQQTPGRAANPTDATPLPIPGADPARANLRVDDKQFLRDAALEGLAEVALGKLAADKAASDAVKKFGKKVVDDHTTTNGQLKKAAHAESIEIPDSLDTKHQDRIDQLAKLSGAEFDKAYIQDQAEGNEQAAKEFTDEIQGGSNATVMNFAAKNLPTLQEHLSLAKNLTKNAKAQ
jgi:putative membrane protein